VGGRNIDEGEVFMGAWTEGRPGRWEAVGPRKTGKEGQQNKMEGGAEKKKRGVRY